MDNRPIGVFDSGLGGLSVVKELKKVLPNESIVYFGDTGRVPYGSRGKEIIIKYSTQDVNFLMEFNIKAIVVACGTVSSVALPKIKDLYQIPILGVVEPASLMAVKETKNNKIGILGTSGTINSGSYAKRIKSINSDIEVTSVACPMFVPLVENGYADSQASRLIAEDYLKPLIENNVDTVILGCTHYPHMEKVISEIMGSNVKLINVGVSTAEKTKEILFDNDMLSNSSKADFRYFVSDSVEDFERLGSSFLNEPISHEVTKIEIEKY